MAWLDVSHLRIEWRQRSARLARSTTPRARAQHAAGNLDNRHVEIVCAASAHVNVSVLYQFVDTANRPSPTSVAPWQGIPVEQRVARSFPERWPADLPRDISLPVQGHQLAQRGSLVAAPSNRGAEMDAKSRDLALLSFLSLSCAVSAWAGDRDIFGSVFFALGTVAMLGTAYGQRR